MHIHLKPTLELIGAVSIRHLLGYTLSRQSCKKRVLCVEQNIWYDIAVYMHQIETNNL
jgi:hypothetical protein